MCRSMNMIERCSLICWCFSWKRSSGPMRINIIPCMSSAGVADVRGPPRRSHIVSFSATITCQRNKRVCIGYFHFHNLLLLPVIGSVKRFSAAYVVRTNGLSESMVTFKACCISEFWLLTANYVENAPSKGELLLLVNIFDIRICTILLNPFKEIKLEDHPETISLIFMHPNRPETSASIDRHVLCFVGAFNHPYGTDMIRAMQAVNGCTSLISAEQPLVSIHAKLLEGWEGLFV